MKQKVKLSAILLLSLLTASFTFASDRDSKISPSIMDTHAIESSQTGMRERGFATSGDLILTYYHDLFYSRLGYDFGYKINKMLYVGAGPIVSGIFGNGSSAVEAGGYAKVRFTAPLGSSVKPVIDLRGGYNYNFSGKYGGVLLGGGLGVKFNRFIIGGYCDVSTIKEVTVHNGTITWSTSVRRGSGKTPTKHVSSYTNISEKNKLDFKPCIYFSYEF